MHRRVELAFYNEIAYLLVVQIYTYLTLQLLLIPKLVSILVYRESNVQISSQIVIGELNISILLLSTIN